MTRFYFCMRLKLECADSEGRTLFSHARSVALDVVMVVCQLDKDRNSSKTMGWIGRKKVTNPVEVETLSCRWSWMKNTPRTLTI